LNAVQAASSTSFKIESKVLSFVSSLICGPTKIPSFIFTLLKEGNFCCRFKKKKNLQIFAKYVLLNEVLYGMAVKLLSQHQLRDREQHFFHLGSVSDVFSNVSPSSAWPWLDYPVHK
jgi:hypothetical protein